MQFFGNQKRKNRACDQIKEYFLIFIHTNDSESWNVKRVMWKTEKTVSISMSVLTLFILTRVELSKMPKFLSWKSKTTIFSSFLFQKFSTLLLTIVAGQPVVLTLRVLTFVSVSWVSNTTDMRPVMIIQRKASIRLWYARTLTNVWQVGCPRNLVFSCSS